MQHLTYKLIANPKDKSPSTISQDEGVIINKH